MAFALIYAVKATGTLRISREGELEGLDLHEHGASAYLEFAMVTGPRVGSGHTESVLAPTFAPSGAANMITPGDFKE